MSETVCRTCLAANIKMLDIKNTLLEDTFEKLTNTKLGARSWVCYICVSQLHRCWRFVRMCARADRALRQPEGIGYIPESVSQLRMGCSFITTPVEALSLPAGEPLVVVKMEPAEIKEEVDDSLYEAVKTEGDRDMERICQEESLKMPSQVYPQRYCYKTYTARQPQRKHNPDPHRANYKYYCEYCFKGFGRSDALKSHMSYCDAKFADKLLVAVNKSNCTKQYRNRNKSSDKPSSNSVKAPSQSVTPSSDHDKPWSNVKSSNNSDKPSNDITYACEYCDKTFTNKYQYNNHIRSHTKPFSCGSCKKSFSELSSLRKHATTHSDDTPYTCEHCGKGFKHRSFLIVHLRSHSGERPYPCALCPASFAQVGHLATHRLTHEPRTHKCDVCEKTFTLSSSLRRHSRTHTGSRPFSCEICRAAFAASDTLASHLRRHSGAKPYVCVCGQAFAARGNMLRHKKTHVLE